ncbi:MAG TPA: zf-HC2 domain-containing protein [Terriglobales bacterium]|nr:zf-HC2 domain-containing protein [Terriglobales bacterium]
MNCPSDGTLQARLDGELGAAELKEVNEHLASCSSCRGRLEQIQGQTERVQNALSGLAPVGETVDAARALVRFRAALDDQLEPKRTWMGKLFAPRLRPAWGALALVCAVAVLLSVAPARTFAEKILAMLRVKRITVVSVYPPRTEARTDQRTAKMLSQLISDNVVVTMDAGKPQPQPSAVAASKLAGFDVRTIGQLGTPQKILVNGEAAFQMTLNRDRMQAILQEAGRSDIQLPAAIDGALVAVHIPRTVFTAYGNCPEHVAHHGPPSQRPDGGLNEPTADNNCVFMVQAPSPTVSVPPNLNISQVAEAALELAGMSPAEAHSFCQTVDWSSTLVVPVPGNISSYQTVSVDGVTGTLISMPSDRNRYSLLWVKGGIIYSLNGHGDPNQALNLAASLSD